MAIGSDNDFPALADFVLNQILGYQDVNDMKSRSARLRDAFNRAHAWNDNAVGNVAWDASAESHASTVDLGQHSGNIGVAAGTGKTVYFGDGSNLTGLAGVVDSHFASTAVAANPFWIFTWNLQTRFLEIKASATVYRNLGGGNFYYSNTIGAYVFRVVDGVIRGSGIGNDSGNYLGYSLNKVAAAWDIMVQTPPTWPSAGVNVSSINLGARQISFQSVAGAGQANTVNVTITEHR